MKTILKITVLLLVLSTFYNCSKDDNTPEPILPQVQENNAPVLSAQTFMAAEDIADNLPIGTVTATDPDSDDLTFSISSNDAALFEISDTGVLSLDDLQSLDFETNQSHTIIVAASDGTISTEATITINVTDVDDTSFVSTWQTTTSNETVIIPTRESEFAYDYTIDWGDGTTQTGRTGDASHSYATAGTYTVSISGTFPAIHTLTNEDARAQLRSIEQWGIIEWQTMEEAFIAVQRLNINAADRPNLGEVVNMFAMFAFVNLSGEINHWDVSNITNMQAVFSISSFNQDISGWDVTNVTNMGNMFNASSFNQNISNWDVSNVTDMSNMFNDSDFNQDISGWNVSNVTDMSSMFRDSAFNQDISSWNVSNVTNMTLMFNDSIFNQDISGWNVSNVTEMSFMFEDSSFNQDISDWNVGNVTSMVRMFQGSPFNQDISTWDVSNVIGMGSMFRNSSFNQDISEWEVGNVVNMIKMFEDSSFNQDISGWNVANVTNCADFSLNAPLTPANTPNFTNCTP